MSDGRLTIVTEVLTFLAGGWVANEDDQEYLRDVLAALPSDPHDWWACPMCQEVQCDDGCPLYPIRDEAGIWVGSKGSDSGLQIVVSRDSRRRDPWPWIAEIQRDGRYAGCLVVRTTRARAIRAVRKEWHRLQAQRVNLERIPL